MNKVYFKQNKDDIEMLDSHEMHHDICKRNAIEYDFYEFEDELTIVGTYRTNRGSGFKLKSNKDNIIYHITDKELIKILLKDNKTISGKFGFKNYRYPTLTGK